MNNLCYDVQKKITDFLLLCKFCNRYNLDFKIKCVFCSKPVCYSCVKTVTNTKYHYDETIRSACPTCYKL